MKLTFQQSEIEFYIQSLLLSNFPFPRITISIPSAAHDLALQRLEYSFKHIHRKYYHSNSQTLFDPLNSDHLCMYLWFLANSLFSGFDDERLAVMLSHLNKRLHGLDLFYSVPMPDIFLLVHPVGSVFGSAQYSNYFVAYQNCTIGADGAHYPCLGEGTVCYSKSSILGSSVLGSDVVLAANSFILNTNVDSDTIVTGSYPNNRFIPNRLSTIERIFSH